MRIVALRLDRRDQLGQWVGVQSIVRRLLGHRPPAARRGSRPARRSFSTSTTGWPSAAAACAASSPARPPPTTSTVLLDGLGDAAWPASSSWPCAHAHAQQVLGEHLGVLVAGRVAPGARARAGRPARPAPWLGSKRNSSALCAERAGRHHHAVKAALVDGLANGRHAARRAHRHSGCICAARRSPWRGPRGPRSSRLDRCRSRCRGRRRSRPSDAPSARAQCLAPRRRSRRAPTRRTSSGRRAHPGDEQPLRPSRRGRSRPRRASA